MTINNRSKINRTYKQKFYINKTIKIQKTQNSLKNFIPQGLINQKLAMKCLKIITYTLRRRRIGLIQHKINNCRFLCLSKTKSDVKNNKIHGGYLFV